MLPVGPGLPILPVFPLQRHPLFTWWVADSVGPVAFGDLQCEVCMVHPVVVVVDYRESLWVRDCFAQCLCQYCAGRVFLGHYTDWDIIAVDWLGHYPY